MNKYLGFSCRLTGGLAVGAFALSAFTPLPNRLHSWTAIRAHVGPADAIVVLGSSVSPDGLLDAPSLRRILDGVVLSRRGLAPVLLILGCANQGAVEADVRTALALELGVDRAAILTESRGLTTGQEAERAAALLLPRGLRRILLVTGEYHERRAVPVFRQAGFVVLPAAVREEPGGTARPADRLALTAKLTREWLARLYYLLQGRG